MNLEALKADLPVGAVFLSAQQSYNPPSVQRVYAMPGGEQVTEEYFPNVQAWVPITVSHVGTNTRLQRPGAFINFSSFQGCHFVGENDTYPGGDPWLGRTAWFTGRA